MLVTTTLTPGLAPLLPRLKGIVAKTGTVLSHLAILARVKPRRPGRRYHGAMNDLPKAPRLRRRTTGLVTIARPGGRRGEPSPGSPRSERSSPDCVFMIVSLNGGVDRAFFFGLVVVIAGSRWPPP